MFVWKTHADVNILLKKYKVPGTVVFHRVQNNLTIT